MVRSFYTNFDPGSGGALDAAIAGAFAKKKPIFTYTGHLLV